MIDISLKHTLAIAAAAASLLAASGPAQAAPESRLIVYNGHAGLGASYWYQYGPSL